jgi:hypothetical protein
MILNFHSKYFETNLKKKKKKSISNKFKKKKITSAGNTSSLNLDLTIRVMTVVRILLIIQYRPRPEGTFKLKKATMKGRLFTIPCVVNSCSVRTLFGSLGG